MTELHSNIFTLSSTAESLLVQPWESKTNSPKYLRRTSFTILQSQLDLKMQTYPAWPSLYLCSPFHQEHKMLPTGAFFLPPNSSSSELLVPLHTCAPVIIAIPGCPFNPTSFGYTACERNTWSSTFLPSPQSLFHKNPSSSSHLVHSLDCSTLFVKLHITTCCYFALLKAINPLI